MLLLLVTRTAYQCFHNSFVFTAFHFAKQFNFKIAMVHHIIIITVIIIVILRYYKENMLLLYFGKLVDRQSLWHCMLL